MPAEQELPATVRRSSAKARRTWAKAHDAAVRQYGEGARAHRTAFAALKHGFERIGDRWVRKQRPGPSDDRAATGAGATAGGVDARATTRHLREVARRLDIRGRSSMSKTQLVAAIRKANDAATRAAQRRTHG